MADQPENKPTQGSGESSESLSGWHDPASPKSASGWHEPPEAARPAGANAWYTPQGAAVPPPEEPVNPAEEIVLPEIPGIAPDQIGAWYTPPRQRY